MTTSANDGLSEPARRLLEAVLAGETSATAPAVVAMVADDAAFARALEQLLDVHHELMHLDPSRRHGADFAPDPELEAVAVAAIRRLAAAAPPASAGMPSASESTPRPRSWRRPALLLAAALLTVWIAVWTFGGDVGVDRRQQLAGAIGVRELPDGTGLGFDFRLGASGHFEITVRDGDRLLLPAVRAAQPEWRPATELVAAWPATVTVEVVAFLGPGAQAASTAYVWRLRR